MEYIVGIAVVAAIAYLLYSNKKSEAVVEAQPEAAPYKVETPEAKVEAVNAQPVVAETKPAKAKKAPAKKAAPKAPKAKAPAKATAKKPATKKPKA